MLEDFRRNNNGMSILAPQEYAKMLILDILRPKYQEKEKKTDSTLQALEHVFGTFPAPESALRFPLVP
jgi:hypothetical protein